MTCVAALAMCSSCVAVSALSVQAMQPPSPTAFITTERVVYGYDQPVDLTFSIAVPDGGSVVPDFSIVNEEGETVAARDVDGRYFWETPGEAIDGTQRPGSIPAGRQHTEIIDDLHQWYELDEPGMYRITFDGQWMPEANRDARAELKQVVSNTLMIRIARPPREHEPQGEPTEGREILLSDVWALDMPGTKPMQLGMQQVDPPVYRAPEGRYVVDIRREVAKAERLKEPAPAIFVVRGSGLEALEEAHAVLLGQRQARQTVRRGDQASLCFVSHAFGDHVQLRKIAYHGSCVSISYEPVPRNYLGVSWHIALIPIQFDEIGIIPLEARPIIQEGRWALPGYDEFIRARMPRSGIVEVVE